jgi:hypothetical protein
MLCEHLRGLEREIAAAAIREVFRGRPWSQNCREWVAFDCYLDLAAIRARWPLADSVRDHSNDDERSGLEAGLVCHRCWDGIVGIHPRCRRAESVVFPRPAPAG